MNTNEPTTGEIVRALRCDGDANNCVDCRYATCDTATILCDQEQNVRDAAYRLESQERTIAEVVKLNEKQAHTIAALTARAESAERERDAAIADMKLIVDAVREEYCDETCCFACKFDCDTSINDSGEYGSECPGFDRDDCFEWRGQPQEGEGK